MRRLLIGLVFAGVLLAQRGTYTVERKSSLSSTAEVITVQLETSATTVTVQMAEASVYCSAQCEVTLERSGTLATTTAIIPTPTADVGMQAVAAVAH